MTVIAHIDDEHKDFPYGPRVVCPFLDGDDVLRAYHDEEWGRPELDSRAMWETLVLLGFASGLSWRTILQKRDALRDAFAGFDPARVAQFEEPDIARLMKNADIVRSRPKIEAAIANARAYEAMREAGDDLASFVYSVASSPFAGRFEVCHDLAEELKARGFRFIGPVLVHGWLESTGVWNNHAPPCPLHDSLPEPLVYGDHDETIDDVLARIEQAATVAEERSEASA